MKAESFGYKNGWIAARDVQPAAVADALSLRNVRPADWNVGLEAAYDYPAMRSVFVTPPIDGWVLCVGLPLMALDESSLVLRLPEWAARLGTEVQYFATHRVTEAHTWARARPAGLERGYSYVGETGEKLLDHGPPTAEERALGFAFFDPNHGEDDAAYWARQDLTFPGEEHVMALAGQWSVDPTTLQERELDVGDGLIGDFGDAPSAPRPPGAPAAKPAKNRWWKFW